MLVKGNRFDCPNILCDYEEEIEDGEMIRTLMRELLGLPEDKTATSLS